jgi:cell division septal protein FtsQ
MKFSSRQFPTTQPKARLFPVHEKSSRKIERHLVLGITFAIALLFIYHLSSERGAFRVKQIAVSGSNRYTRTEIIAALGLSHRQSNVHTISESEIEKRIKQKLSYIKQANISKSVVKRSLTIEITERKPVALLKDPKNSEIRFVLVDLDGYMLEYTSSSQAADAIVTIIGDGQQLPGLGNQIDSDGVQLALKVIRVALSLTTKIVSALRTIDANQPDKITLQFSNLPVVWLSSDLIETKLYHVGLFMKNRTTLMKKGQKTSNPLNGYLDARFEDAVYWGGR